MPYPHSPVHAAGDYKIGIFTIEIRAQTHHVLHQASVRQLDYALPQRSQKSCITSCKDVILLPTLFPIGRNCA